MNVHIDERWTAEYQVLSGRTHPHMMMDSAAGFMLSGITVNNRTHVQPASKRIITTEPTEKRKRAPEDSGPAVAGGGAKKAKE